MLTTNYPWSWTLKRIICKKTIFFHYVVKIFKDHHSLLGFVLYCSAVRFIYVFDGGILSYALTHIKRRKTSFDLLPIFINKIILINDANRCKKWENRAYNEIMFDGNKKIYATNDLPSISVCRIDLFWRCQQLVGIG